MFIILTQDSVAAQISGSKLNAAEEPDVSLKEDGGAKPGCLKKIKFWLLSHSQHLNFFTILVLASVSLVHFYFLFY